MLVTQHYSDVTIGTMASQITSLAIVCSTVYSSADQRKYQSSASMAFVRGIHRWPGNSPHKWPVTRKMFPFDDVIMNEVAHVIHMELRESSTCACYIYIYITYIHLCTHKCICILYFVAKTTLWSRLKWRIHKILSTGIRLKRPSCQVSGFPLWR